MTLIPAGSGKMSVTLEPDQSFGEQGTIVATIPYGSGPDRRRLLDRDWSLERSESGTRYYTRRFADPVTNGWPALVAALRDAYRTVYGESYTFDLWAQSPFLGYEEEEHEAASPVPTDAEARVEAILARAATLSADETRRLAAGYRRMAEDTVAERMIRQLGADPGVVVPSRFGKALERASTGAAGRQRRKVLERARTGLRSAAGGRATAPGELPDATRRVLRRALLAAWVAVIGLYAGAVLTQDENFLPWLGATLLFAIATLGATVRTRGPGKRALAAVEAAVYAEIAPRLGQNERALLREPWRQAIAGEPARRSARVALIPRVLAWMSLGGLGFFGVSGLILLAYLLPGRNGPSAAVMGWPVVVWPAAASAALVLGLPAILIGVGGLFLYRLVARPDLPPVLPELEGAVELAERWHTVALPATMGTRGGAALALGGLAAIVSGILLETLLPVADPLHAAGRPLSYGGGVALAAGALTVGLARWRLVRRSGDPELKAKWRRAWLQLLAGIAAALVFGLAYGSFFAWAFPPGSQGSATDTWVLLIPALAIAVPVGALHLLISAILGRRPRRWAQSAVAFGTPALLGMVIAMDLVR
jgi:hypothetical protein